MKVRRIDYSADEFLVGTRALSDAECGVYWRACSLIYSHGGPVHIAELKRWCSTRRGAFEAIVDRLVNVGKLSRNGDEIGQNRAERELERAANRTRVWRENGAKGGRKSHENNGLEEPSGLSENNRASNYQLSTINHTPSNDGVERVKRATRLAKDFEMSLDWIEDGSSAREKAKLPPVDLATEAIKFTNHFLSKGGREGAKLDWHRTWLNWCLNAKGSPNAGRLQSEPDGIWHDRPTGPPPRPEELWPDDPSGKVAMAH